MNIKHYQSMLAREGYGDESNQIVRETHASWIILSGQNAFKIKKPVNYGFLDFTTLEKRKTACLDEIRLNKQNAKNIYIEALPIYEKNAKPTFAQTDQLIEYAVHMHRFDERNLLSEVIQKRALTHKEVDGLAECIVSAHQHAVVIKTGELGHPDVMQGFVLDNFSACEALSGGHTHLTSLRNWAQKTYKKYKPLMEKRRVAGLVRECHGDLHLGNIVLLNGIPTLFDAIEFNVDFRCTDIMADIGFIMMDLMQRDLSGMASRLLNYYLEKTGDYEGLQVLPYFICYRAMIRAKVALLTRNNITDAQMKINENEKYLQYLAFAKKLIQPHHAWLILMHGISGSGKTTLSQALLDDSLFIRIRADIERKRLHQKHMSLRLYEEKMSQLMHDRLYDLASILLTQKFNVILDATFIKRAVRERFFNLAKQKHSHLLVLDCEVSDEIRFERVQKRASLGKDASDATPRVVEMQRANAEPLDSTERAFTLSINLAKEGSMIDAVQQIRKILPSDG